MKRRKWDYLFLGVILILLLGGLIRTLFFPKTINYYENRYAVQIPQLSSSSWLNGAFQDETEKAFSDQIPGAQRVKKGYYQAVSKLERKLIATIFTHGNSPQNYVRLGDYRLFGDWLTYWPRTLSACQPDFDKKIIGLNKIFAAHPEVDFYLYYIEKDTDIDFETNQKLQGFEYISQRLTLPSTHMACFQINDFLDFSKWFYQTDHHWNADGSLRGYRQVLELLEPDDIPLEPSGPLQQLGVFSGSKATGVDLESFTEPFKAYPYDYKPMTITVNGIPSADYGAQAQYQSGAATEPINYGNYYGTDLGEVIFDTENSDLGNLLVLGESYDNAILKLLASHFNCTYAVDLRYYETYMGHSFHLSDYLQEHEIDRVLLIGNVDYYVMDTFCPED